MLLKMFRNMAPSTNERHFDMEPVVCSTCSSPTTERESARERQEGEREEREARREGGREGTKLLGADARSITLSENAVTTRIYLTIVLLTRAPGSELRATQSHGGFQAEVGKLRHA